MQQTRASKGFFAYDDSPIAVRIVIERFGGYEDGKKKVRSVNGYSNRFLPGVPGLGMTEIAGLL